MSGVFDTGQPCIWRGSARHGWYLKYIIPEATADLSTTVNY